jgi:hypothetical protein
MAGPPDPEHRMGRVLGIVIAACGLALCHGAVQLWPASGALTAIDALRIVGAAVAAVLGVLNVGAGLVILFFKPARE